MSTTRLQRRDFLRVSLAAGGGLLIGFRSSARAAQATPTAPDADVFAPNAWVRISTAGAVTVMINKAEMGQGVSTALAMVLAEELDADWKTVGFEFAPAAPEYGDPVYQLQMVGGSTSVKHMYEPLRAAGAMARALLVQAAAAQWGVGADECSTHNGAVVHAASERRTTYGELASAAAQLEAPADVKLKDPANFKRIGVSTRRLDTPDKSRGVAKFAIDIELPGMLTALVAHPPTFGGRAKSISDAAALAVPGVVKVVDVGSGVAVIAKNFWAAKRGRDALKVEWDLGANAALSSERLRAEYRQLARTPGIVARRDGEGDKVLNAGAQVLEADFELPYLAHAPMEPLACVVDLRADSMDIWAGSQFQTVDQGAAAAVAGLAPERVKLHTTFLGGGFGRRANPVADYIVEGVKIARHAGAPVKLIWTRDDDMRGGYYRPMWHSRIRGALDSKGELVGWAHTIVGQSFIAGTAFEPFIIKDGIDGTSVEGAVDLPYSIPNVQVELHTTKVGVPTLWWRSVGHSHTAFVVEHFFDELARAAKQDPYELRRRLLTAHPRQLAVLERAASAAGWGQPLPEGRARGIALHASFSSIVAQVVEASLEGGEVRVHRVVCAVDCGRIVNPDTVVAQLEGAVGFGLTSALYSEISLRDGRVEQSNFHDYKMLRMHQMPKVEVHLIASDQPPTGIGEPGVPPVAPALCNALLALTGKPIHRLPIRVEDLGTKGARA
jgi:isoquinoline 1-oxidoreductase beta subunit